MFYSGKTKEFQLPDYRTGDEVVAIELEEEKEPEVKVQKAEIEESKDVSDLVSMEALEAMNKVEIPPEKPQEEKSRLIAAEPLVTPPPEPEKPAVKVASKARPATVQKRKLAAQKARVEKTRKNASVEKKETQIPEAIKTALDYVAQTTKVFRNFLQFEVSSFNLVSSIRTQGAAQGIGGSLLGRYWNSFSTFIEAKLGTKLVSSNSASSKVSPLLLDAQYHKSWFWSLARMGFIKTFQFTAFGGGEYYSNGASSERIFVSQYMMAEAGTSFRFDLFDKWDAGGALLLGYDITGKAQKYQVQGDVNYRLMPLWDFSVGYRTRLYEAKTPAGSPDGALPSREANSEIFGTLRYLFDK